MPKFTIYLLSALTIVAMISYKFVLPQFSKASILSMPQDIIMSASVCTEIENVYPVITSDDNVCQNLEWSNIQFVTGYENCQPDNVEYLMEMSGNNSFAPILLSSGWINDQTFTPIVPQNGLAFYFRVRARVADSPDRVSAWSDTHSCFAETPPPPPPSPPSNNPSSIVNVSLGLLKNFLSNNMLFSPEVVQARCSASSVVSQ